MLATSNQNIEEAVENKALRDDVYYRLAVVEIELPALRERVEDIPLIASEMLKKFAASADKNIRSFSPEAMEILLNYAWPGNVRELRNAIERAVILSRNEQIAATDLPPRLRQTGSLSEADAKSIPANMVAVSLGTTVDEMERQLILRTLEMQGNNKTRAAEVLGVSLKTLHNKLNRYAKEENLE